jgi:hypothetical protein
VDPTDCPYLGGSVTCITEALKRNRLIMTRGTTSSALAVGIKKTPPILTNHSKGADRYPAWAPKGTMLDIETALCHRPIIQSVASPQLQRGLGSHWIDAGAKLTAHHVVPSLTIQDEIPDAMQSANLSRDCHRPGLPEHETIVLFAHKQRISSLANERCSVDSSGTTWVEPGEFSR